MFRSPRLDDEIDVIFPVPHSREDALAMSGGRVEVQTIGSPSTMKCEHTHDVEVPGAVVARGQR